MNDLDDFWPPSGAGPLRRSDSARAQPGKREKALSRDEIVRAAIIIADAEGTGAINMRRIAKEVGVGAMSLYWHVADKDQLLDLMLNVVEGEGSAEEATGDWREDLALIARQRRCVLLRHPWVLDLISGRSPFGPNALLQIERSLTVLDVLELATRAKLQVLMVFDNYVTGSVLNELREVRVEQTQSQARIADDDIVAELQAWRDRLDRSGMFERVLRVFDEGIDPDAEETREERFEFGLQCVLDGVDSRVSQLLGSGSVTNNH